MAKRLSIALVLSILIGFGCYVILPRYGVTLPPWVPVLAFAFMVLASIAVEFDRDKDEDEDDEQAPFGCNAGNHDQLADNGNEPCTCPTHSEPARPRAGPEQTSAQRPRNERTQDTQNQIDYQTRTERPRRKEAVTDRPTVTTLTNPPS